MSFEIRLGTPQDAPFFADSWRSMLDELEMAPNGYKPDWRRRLIAHFRAGMEERTQGWFVAYSAQGAPVGCAGALLSETALIQVDRFGTIAGVWVEPEARRRGLARLLTLSAIAWAKEQGCVGLRLIASQKAEPLYRSLGFEDGRELVLKLR